MPKMLADEGIEYDDGTPASESQQAKDVTTFLSWCVIYKLAFESM
jgi:ubiquinol-cytochrome c reductase cytochrome c1 subunit